MPIGSYVLTKLKVTLSDVGLSFQGDANLPVIGTVDNLQGTIQDPTDFTLSAAVTQGQTLQFGKFALSDGNVTLHDVAGSVTLTASGTVDLPLFQQVTFIGNISADGTYSLSYNIEPFSVSWGLLHFQSGTLTLSSIQVTIIVAAEATLAQTDIPVGILEGLVSFSGTIAADNTYTLTATKTINLGSFTILGATLILDNLHHFLGLGFTAPIPYIGIVSFSGSIGPNGQYSVTGSYSPSVKIGVLTLDNITFNWSSNVGLILSATASYDDFTVNAKPGGDITILSVFTATATAEIFHDGTFEGTVDAHAFTILGYNWNDAQVSFGNADPQFGNSDISASIDSGTSPSVQGSVAGSVSSLTATLNGLTSNAEAVPITNGNFVLDEPFLAKLVNSSASTLLDGSYSLELTPDNDESLATTVNFTVSSGVTLAVSHEFMVRIHGDVTIPSGPTLSSFDGYVTPDGNYDFRTSEDVPLGGLTLYQSQFDLNKTQGLTFSAHTNLGVFTAQVNATVTPDGAGGFTASATAVGQILDGPNLSLSGYLDSQGNYDFKVDQDFVLGDVTPSKAHFELSNTTGLTISDNWNFGVFAGNFAATISVDGQNQGYVLTVDANGKVFGSPIDFKGNLHSNGQFDLQGEAAADLGTISLAAVSFDIGNENPFGLSGIPFGATVLTFTAPWNFVVFQGSLSGTVVATAGGFDIALQGSGSMLGAENVSFKGDLNSDGRFDLQAKALRQNNFANDSLMSP